MRSILIILFFMLIMISAKLQAQKWQPAHFTDVKGNKGLGFIRVDPTGPGPVKGEGYIEFKTDKKAKPFDLSASDIQSFVIGRDSFIVAHAPKTGIWTKNELDFVKVVLDEDVKLYAARGGRGGGGFAIEPGIGIGIGTGFGFGSRGIGGGGGIGGGVEIPFGGGRGGEGGRSFYYYGENTGEMKMLTDANFADVMTDIMGDYPDVVDKIAAKVYTLANINDLIAYFNQVKAAHVANGAK
jgi:hypothetical protein